jgi:hypothetical protein
MLKNEPASGVQLRKYSRLPVDFPVTYQIDGTALSELGRSRDIGGGGIYFESNEVLAKGACLVLWFDLEPGLKIEARGVVASSTPNPATQAYQHRVAFSDLPENVRSIILAFVFEAWRAALLKIT